MKHGHGNDGLAMPASVAHRGMDLFDHRRGGEERGDGHQHHQSPATASDPQDGLIAVIGGSAMAAGDASVVSGFVESFAMGQGAYSIAMCRAPISSSNRKSGNRNTDRTMRRNSTTSRLTFMGGRNGRGARRPHPVGHVRE
jgi:hypothetical protein